MRNRTDNNQSQIVKDLRDSQVQVVVTSKMGDSFPDLLVCGVSGWVLLEVKEKSGEIKRNQLQFIADSKGYVSVVVDYKTALEAATIPRIVCFTQKEKDLIAVYLTKWQGDRMSVKKFFREVVKRKIYWGYPEEL